MATSRSDRCPSLPGLGVSHRPDDLRECHWTHLHPLNHKIFPTLIRDLNQPILTIEKAEELYKSRHLSALIEVLKLEAIDLKYKSVVLEILKKLGLKYKKVLKELEEISVEIGRNYTVDTKKEILHFQTQVIETIRFIRKALKGK